MSWLETDRNITFWLYRDNLSTGQEQAIYVAASLFVYLLPLVLIYLFFYSYRDRLNATKVFLTAVLAWQVISHFLGQYLYVAYQFRSRPFAERGLQELFFERPEKAFPSDHAAVLMAATLAFFSYKYPKLGWTFLIGGVVLSSLSRVVIGFHWFGDVLGGWAVGMVAFGLIRLLDRPLTAILDRILTGLRLKRKADTFTYNGSKH